METYSENALPQYLLYNKDIYTYDLNGIASMSIGMPKKLLTVIFSDLIYSEQIYNCLISSYINIYRFDKIMEYEKQLFSIIDEFRRKTVFDDNKLSELIHLIKKKVISVKNNMVNTKIILILIDIYESLSDELFRHANRININQLRCFEYELLEGFNNE